MQNINIKSIVASQVATIIHEDSQENVSSKSIIKEQEDSRQQRVEMDSIFASHKQDSGWYRTNWRMWWSVATEVMECEHV